MRVVRQEDIAAPFMAPRGELIYEMIGRPEAIGGTTNHSFVHVVVPPGKGSPPHYHKVSEETYYVVAGAGDLTVDGVEKILRPGDACLIMPGEHHEIRNSGDVALEFITISAPAWVPDDTYPVEDGA